MSDLLPLFVALPILAAVIPVVLGLKWKHTGWPVAAVTSVVLLALAVRLAQQVFSGGPVTHELAGFPAPQGIPLVADGLSALVALLIAVTTVGVLAFARRAGPHSDAFYSEFLLLVAGLFGLSLTGDMFNLYVFLEITGLTAYALVSSGESGEAAVAALRYLIIGTVGASLYLLGVGYAFVATGTLNMADFSRRVAVEAGFSDPLVLASFALIFVGLSVKIALFPLHTWQPSAYSNAPTTVAAFISALVSTTAAYALARITFSAFTVEFLAANPIVQTLVTTVAGVSIIAGATLAVMQSDLRRMLAYSSVSQFGLVVAAIGIANETALLGAIFHLVGHAIMKGGLFVATGVLAAGTGARTVDDYAGLSRRMPFTSGAFAVLAFALVGVPPAVGFIGKWYIALGAIRGEAWPIAAVILASTLLTLSYFARVLERMYFTPPAESSTPAVTDGGQSPVSTSMVAVAVLAAVVAVVLGPLSSQLVEPLLKQTIETLLHP